jgi:eukaryotic-like serine/threonine-protein kinase
VQDVQSVLPVGSIIRDRYIVEELLGRGGFSAVYRVRDLRVKGNMFALKELIDSSKQERDRFTFEGEVLKRLDHPALPRVYRVFEDDKNNRVYMLMDYIEGPNLEVLRQRQPGKRFAVPEVMAIMASVVSAIGYLHKQHPPIIHRDVKPANIIVPSAGQETVLVDFGIAKEYQQDSTTTAVRHCSPGYGAPEQYVRGTNTRTDIYGLGATFYALLTGLVPADALYRMTQLGSRGTDPLEPVTQLAPDVPAHIADAIHHAMSINSNERFPTVEEFWQALNAQPISAQRALPAVAPVAAADPSSRPPLAAPAAGLPTVISASTAAVYGQLAARRRGVLVALLALLALFAFVLGLVFGTGLWSSLSHLTHPAPPAIQRLAHKATPTAKPTATPTPVPTATPTPRPTATPTPQPSGYPVVAPSYAGTIHNIPASVSSTISLSQIQQQGTNISGYLSVGSDLQGNGSFTGAVSTDKKIQFLVQAFANHLPLFFQGQIQANGNMSGQYCSYRADTHQCDYNAGGYGTWSVSSVSPGSSSFSPGSFIVGDLSALVAVEDDLSK